MNTNYECRAFGLWQCTTLDLKRELGSSKELLKCWLIIIAKHGSQAYIIMKCLIFNNILLYSPLTQRGGNVYAMGRASHTWFGHYPSVPFHSSDLTPEHRIITSILISDPLANRLTAITWEAFRYKTFLSFESQWLNADLKPISSLLDSISRTGYKSMFVTSFFYLWNT